MIRRPMKHPLPVTVAARVMSDTGVSRVDSSVTWQMDNSMDNSIAGQVPLFGYLIERGHATGDHDDATKDNRGAL